MKSIAVAIGCVQKATLPIAWWTLALVGDEAMLLDQVACELAETITLAVAVKGRAERSFQDRP